MRFFVVIAALLVSAFADDSQHLKNEAKKHGKSMDSHGLTIECDYGIIRHYWGEMYTCLARNFETLHYYDYIVNATGDHMVGKTDADVQAVYFLGQNVKFLPYNISTAFTGLRAIRVESSGLRYLNRTLRYEGPIEYLHLENNRLEEVPVWAFKGLKTLKWLSFRGNSIRYLEASLFREMPQLRRFSVSRNMIEIVPSGMFVYNTELEEVYFYNNKIRMIGGRLVERLEKLKVAAFRGNPCTEISVYDGADIKNKLTTEFVTRCNVNCDKSERAAQEEIRQLQKEIKKQQKYSDDREDAGRQREYRARHPAQPKASSESNEN